MESFPKFAWSSTFAFILIALQWLQQISTNSPKNNLQWKCTYGCLCLLWSCLQCWQVAAVAAAAKFVASWAAVTAWTDKCEAQQWCHSCVASGRTQQQHGNGPTLWIRCTLPHMPGWAPTPRGDQLRTPLLWWVSHWVVALARKSLTI